MVWSSYTSEDLLLKSKAEIDRYDQALYLTKQIIEGLTDEATLEIFKSTNSKGIESVFDKIFDETYNVLFGSKIGSRVDVSNLGYLDKLTESVEEELRCNSLAYFITSVLPDFEMNWHHYQWASIPEMFKKFVVLASRGSGKSYMYSNAYPAWQLYKFKPKNSKERGNNRGLLFSFSIVQAIDLMAILKDTIESADILRDRLYNKESWSKGDITCLNKARLTVKGFGSTVRGIHPSWIICDDILKDNILYSSDANQKGIDYFHGSIGNLLMPGGSFGVVGCVNEETIVPIQGKGLIKIKDIVEIKNKDKKQLIKLKENIFGRNGIKETSHFWNNGWTKTKKIILRGNYNLECSLKHPILVMNKFGIPLWEKTKNLEIGDYVGVKIGTNIYGNKISLKEFNEKEEKNKWSRNDINFPDYVTPDLAYLIGLYLSEGNIDRNGKSNVLRISTTEQDIIYFLQSSPFGMKFIHRKNNCWATSCKKFVELLEYLNCPIERAENKNIPYCFLQADFEAQKGLLQGMFDGDGSSSIRDNTVEIELSSTSKKMIENVSIILNNIGILNNIYTTNKVGKFHYKKDGSLIKSNFNVHQVKSYGNYAVYFLEKIGFRLKRKMILVEAKEVINRKKLFTNIIPNQYFLFKKLRETAKLSKTTKYNTHINCRTNVHILQKILDIEINERKCDENIWYKTIKKNIDDNFVWLPIKKIEDSECYTMDFVVPDGHSFISNAVISHNTPFRSNDLYADLREKGWPYFEFPGIYPDGSLLWENKWNYESLLEKKKSQGSLIFSREILVKPVISDATIFPIEILNNAFIRMDTYSLVQNRESFPVKFNRVVSGCDFAISGSVGSDYSVFTTWGIDDNEKMWLMNVVRKKGMSYTEQLGHLKNINANFRPDVMILEKNNFQAIFTEESIRSGLPVIGHTTTASNKNNLRDGLPGLAILFERGTFRIPTGDQKSKDFRDVLISEFSGVVLGDRGFANSSSHDDICMSTWLATEGVRKITANAFDFNFI